MFEITLRHHIMAVLDAYRLSASAFAEATVERKAIGYLGFFGRVRDGGNFSVRKADDALAWFDEHWPADAAWPDVVPRPSLVSAPPAPLVRRGAPSGAAEIAPEGASPASLAGVSCQEPVSGASSQAPSRRGSGLGGLLRRVFS